MLVALITDTHISVRNDSALFSLYFEKFYSNVFFPYLEKHNIKRVMHLGDLFDRRKFINFQRLHDARRFLFEPLRKYQVDVLIGNHDTSLKASNSINSPDLLLNEYANITRYSEPTVISIEGTEIALIPWICADNKQQTMQLLETTSAQIVMGHLELKGFEMYRGSPTNHGENPSMFENFDMVMSGHFHHRSTNGNITYLGSPYEMTWSDYMDPRGFHIFDTDTRQLTFIENPYRMYHKIFYNDVTDDIESAIQEDFSHYKDTYVKVVIQEKTDPYLFDRLIDKIEKAKPFDISYSNDLLNILQFTGEELEDVEDTPAIITSSVDQLTNERLKEPLKKFLLDLYNEAIGMTTV